MHLLKNNDFVTKHRKKSQSNTVYSVGNQKLFFTWNFLWTISELKGGSCRSISIGYLRNYHDYIKNEIGIQLTRHFSLHCMGYIANIMDQAVRLTHSNPDDNSGSTDEAIQTCHVLLVMGSEPYRGMGCFVHFDSMRAEYAT